YDHRRQAFRGLIEEDGAGIPHQGARDAQHLLFTARHLTPRTSTQVPQVREEIEKAIGGPVGHGRPRRLAPHLEVSLGRKIGAVAAYFRYITTTRSREAVAGPGRDVFPPKRPTRRDFGQQANDGLIRRGLAGAVAPQERDQLPFPYMKRHSEDHL